MNKSTDKPGRRGKISRRKFLLWGSGAVAGGVAATSGYVALNNEAEQPVIERVSIPIQGLATALEGFTIAVLADFHLYPLTQLDLINRAVAMANSLKPDVTVLLGDYVWHEVEAVFDLAPALATLDARLGVFAIMGNHDLWTDAAIVKTALDDVGLPWLINEGLSLTAGQSSLFLAGLDDGWSGQPDLDATLQRRPADAPIVLLLHEPDLADDYSLDGRISLQLSGHSHGGQIRLPGVGAIVTPYLSWKYDHGLYQVNDMALYVNRGIGVTNEPVRFNCPPEVTEVVLAGG